MPYVKFRSMAAEYGQRLSKAKEAEYAKLQEQWIKDLEQFANDHPQADDAPEALLQVGLGQEFAGQDEAAAKTYGRIVSNFSDSEQAKKATGAKFRLESVGKPMPLQGKTLDGKTFDICQAARSSDCRSILGNLVRLVQGRYAATEYAANEIREKGIRGCGGQPG